MFEIQDWVGNLDRRMQKPNDSLYRKEMKNRGSPLGWNCKGKKKRD